MNRKSGIAALLFSALGVPAMPASAAISDLVIDPDGNYVVPSGEFVVLDESFEVPAGKLLIIEGSLNVVNDAKLTFASNASLSLASTGRLLVNSQQGVILPSGFDLDLSNGGKVEVGGLLQFSGGGTFLPLDEMDFVSGFPTTTGRIDGPVSIDTGREVRIRDGAVIGADFNIQQGGSAKILFGDFENLTVEGDFNIHGEFVVDDNEVNVNGHVEVGQAGNVFTDSTTWNVGNGITVRNGGTFGVSVDSTFNVGTAFVIENGGMAELVGTINGDVSNSGTLAVKSVNSTGLLDLTVSGDFTQTGEGVLQFLVRDDEDRSTLFVDGLVVLDGELQVNHLVVPPDQAFQRDLIVADEILLEDGFEVTFFNFGDWFTSYEVLSIGQDQQALRISVNSAPIPVPLPPALAMFPLAAGVMYFARRRMIRGRR